MEHHLPTYAEYIDTLKQGIDGRTDIRMETCGMLQYETKDGIQEYPYYKVSSADIRPTDKILLIRATIHGDETAGAMTIMRHVAALFDYAHAHNVKLIIFPLDNPSGFEHNTRYNIEEGKGDGGNNDFIRYELEDGSIVGDIGTSEHFKTWRWASDPDLHVHLPKETAMLHAELKKLPLTAIRGVLDIHQDNYIIFPGAYHYAYGDKERYRPIVDAIERVTTVFKGEHIDSGYLNGPSYHAEIPDSQGNIIPDEFDPVTDSLGFIDRHDCTLPDLFFHLGADHCITVETTTKLTPEQCDEINIIWVKGLVDLISKGK
ncbi:MAG TPA: succinylglutamate desuccinylase/aspartoacylase family protein [Candidatus Kapabacteria bacterium]|nr:succinylglutamate desuccinylase/aspartoacylase family protein [Candidatus Kapabacteria bacterium]